MQRIRAILGLSLPIVAMLLAQNLMSLIVIAMISPLGPAAVAGIGIAGALFSMLMALLFGIDAGVQALVARRLGAGQAAQAGAVLNDALALAVLAGVPLALVGYLAGPLAFRLAAADPAVAAHGLPYLNAALPMLAFLGASFTFSAYRNGAGTPRHALLVVAIQVACGVTLSYLLIFGAFGCPRLETAGAGLAATLAAAIALGFHVLLAQWIAPVPCVLRTRPRWPGLRAILRIGLPVGLQQSLVFLGTAISFAIVGALGTAEVAAMNLLLTLLLLSFLPATGMGIATATLVGTALGRDDIGDARRWGWQAAWLGALGILPFSLIAVLAPRALLGLFMSDATTAALAALPLQLLAVGMSIDAFGRILGFALRGAGATRAVTMIAFPLQWGAQLPLSWLVGVHLGFGLTGIAACRLLLFAVEAALVTQLWHRGLWRRRLTI